MRVCRCIGLFALIAAVIVAGMAVVAWRSWPRTAITAANAAKIRPGMTADEVDTILGGPPRFEATGRVSYCLADIPNVRPISPALREWTSDEVLVMVWIGADGRVQRREVVGVVRCERVDEMILRWLGLD